MSAALGVTGTDYYSLAGTSPIGTWTGHGAYSGTPTTTGYPLIAAVNLAAAAKTQTTPAAIRAGVGLATANLDTQLSGLEGSGLTEAQAAQLTAIEDKTALITSTTVQIVSSVITSGQILPLVSAADYGDAYGNLLSITPTVVPSRTGATVWLHITDLQSNEEVFSIQEIAIPDAAAWIFEPTAAQTALLKRALYGRYQYSVWYHRTTGEMIGKVFGGMTVASKGSV